MNTMKCPECGSIELERIGLYDYQCEVCGDVFDVTEADGDTDDWFPNDDDEFDDGEG